MSVAPFTSTRTTTWGRTGALAGGLAGSLGRVQDLQTQASTGRRIVSWADDPAAATSAQRLRAQEADLASATRTAGDALSWLTAADTSLQQASATLARAQELAVTAGDGAHGPAAREAVAREIESLRDEVAGIANSSHLGRPLLGGFTPNPASRDAAGAWTWSGDGGAQQRQVAPGTTVTVNLDGAAVLGFDGPPGSDVLSVLDGLAAATRAGDATGITASRERLGERSDALRGQLGEVGGRTVLVERQMTASAGLSTTVAADRSRLEDADLAETITQLRAAETSYQAALGAVSRALELPSLASVLR